MKKKLALVLAMILMLSLFGCGDKEDKLGTTVVGGVSEEHQEMIFEAVKELWDTDVYRKAAVDPDVMVVENALHLYMPELYGHTDVEFLLACVEGINEYNHGYCGIVLIDVAEGTTYHSGDLPVDDYAGATSTMEDLYTLCFNTYESFIHWTNNMILTEHEVRTELTANELENMNQRLAQVSEEKEALRLEEDAANIEAASALEGNARLIFDAVLEFGNSSKYRQQAENAEEIQVIRALHYYNDDADAYNGYTPELLFVRVEMSEETNMMYGSSAGHLMIDVTNGESRTVDDLEQNFDMNNPKTTEQMQTLLFWASDAYFEGINPFVWTENETRVELSEEELETINQILNL